MPVKQKKTTY